MLCDLRLGLSLSVLLYSKKALDTDILDPPILPSTRCWLLIMGYWRVSPLPALELALWFSV